MIKAAVPRGTRDFSPKELMYRNYIIDCITKVYEIYGFEEIQTPAMEQLDSLMGKYGEEGDKLLFKIINSGDYLSKADEAALEAKDSKKLLKSISEKGLRYDLTVPFARYVVQHQNDISLPFKRYQVQPVWRADRPQKGRYREFYQCDADVIGSDSLWYEVELIHIMSAVFASLQVPVAIHINHRRLLEAIVQLFDLEATLLEFVIMSIDKMEKVGERKVQAMMQEKGIDESTAQGILSFIQFEGSLEEQLAFLKGRFNGIEAGEKALADLSFVFDKIADKNLPVKLDFQLARGLSYYTGCIFEVKPSSVEFSTICAGGRYDDLTGIFGKTGLSGVGISFGLDRIYDVMMQLDLFESLQLNSVDLLVLNIDENIEKQVFEMVQSLRASSVRVAFYPEVAKMKKQMKYANNIGCPYVMIVGESEFESGLLSLKVMSTGEQLSLSLAGIKEKITSKV